MNAPMLINGRPGLAVSVRDRGFQYGDGLFETLRCERGRLRWFDRHMRRLRIGGERLGIAIPDAGLLRTECESLVADSERALVKIIVTRGEAVARGYAPRGDERPTRVISAHEWPSPAAPAGGFQVGYSAVTLNRNPLLAGLKHLNRLEQVMAQREAVQRQLQEVLMGPSADEAICGSMSNLFVVSDMALVTPPVEECGVAGVVRSLVLDCAERVGFALRVAPVTSAVLAAASAMFVTNVRLGCQVVHRFNGRALSEDKRCLALQELIDGTVD